MNRDSDERALSSIIAAARGVVRRESENLMQATRNSFRPSQSNTRSHTRGRQRGTVWKKTMFLLRRSNADFFPSPIEGSFLEEHGLGKANGLIQRYWSINRLHRYICQTYALVPLENTGFKFEKCNRNKKIVLINFANTISELEAAVGRSILLIIPNRDLDLPDETTASRSISSDVHVAQSDDDDFETESTSRMSQQNRQSNSQPVNTLVSSTPLSSRSNDRTPVILEMNNTRTITTVTERDNSFDEVSEVHDFWSTDAETEIIPDANVQFPSLLDEDIVEIVAISVKRDAILDEMLHLYRDETITQKRIKVEFSNEIGLDYGGLTKELFSEFWRKCSVDFFRGENALVPFLPLSKIRKGHDRHFITIGRILAHTLILTKSLPLYFAKSFYLKLGDLERKIPSEYWRKSDKGTQEE